MKLSDIAFKRERLEWEKKVNEEARILKNQERQDEKDRSANILKMEQEKQIIMSKVETRRQVMMLLLQQNKIPTRK